MRKDPPKLVEGYGRRNRKIRKMCNAVCLECGKSTYTLDRIAKKYGVTRQRIAAICK